MTKIAKTLTLLAGLFLAAGAYAQNKVSAVLLDSSNGEPIPFATVSLLKDGAKKPEYYNLSNEAGVAEIKKVRHGNYTFRAELLGYVAWEKHVKVEGDVDLGKIKMDPDKQLLEAASVSAVGNPIVVKKDTLEYNANSFKTTENDMLEDLLKKLPGVEVSEDGSITVNGETIKKITIEGKTFFLDDPQLASKNIPAKLINKLKVINKKSEQAEFTGIDDGEEEKVIDLDIKPGMMRGAFGNIMAGAGRDIPTNDVVAPETRYQGAAFLGNFTKERQLSMILNGNNTNNRGFNDLSGSMMGNMRGGGGGMGRGQGGWGNGNGITTSYMAGVNGAWTLVDGNMDLSSNYLFNHTGKAVEEESEKVTYAEKGVYNLIDRSQGSNLTNSNGHRFGVRLDHKFSENTSILFEPRLEFGNGNYTQKSETSRYADTLAKAGTDLLSESDNLQSGNNKNITTSGFMLFRQRLGIPGRTMTVMGRYSFSHNDLSSVNWSETTTRGVKNTINQNIKQNQRSSSLMGRATYTEPLGNNLYLEANYRYSWSRSTSEKNTWDNIHDAKDYVYSNEIINESHNQEMGVNLMYQKEKSRAQVGFAALPTNTYNSTTRYNALDGTYKPAEYKDFRWNFSPRVMLWWEFNDNANARMFYRGSSSQPSTRQLMPVPDNSDPLNVSFGNPSLKPYFSHNLRGDIRYNNKRNFTSFNINFTGGYTQNPITSLTWYSGGAAYSMPFNGPDNMNAGINGFANIPIAKSNFSISNFARVNWSKSSNYVGNDINMDTYTKNNDYYAFMDEVVANWKNPTWYEQHITVSTTQSLSAVERFRLTYRSDNLELTASARTRFNRSWNTMSDDKPTTFNNQIRLTANWTWDAPGITFKAEGNYNWYKGYSIEQPSEYVMNAEIQKLLLRKKMTLALKGYDILGQSKNLSVTDNENYHSEVVNNTLGRYIILSLTYRFGTFDRSKMRGPGGMRGGPGGGMGGPGGPPRR
ncbi:MAG: TonB-dependent receptor [Bacteroidales bacterium]|nr:TonB-dependent receptor [Bacteroidales bacterium]